MSHYFIRMELHKLPNKTVEESDYQLLHSEWQRDLFILQLSIKVTLTHTYFQLDVTEK
jgi:hypothetical protein